MTFKEMIFKGLCDGTVKIISNPNDDCIACQIGEFWFYFIGSEDENLTPDDLMKLNIIKHFWKKNMHVIKRNPMI